MTSEEILQAINSELTVPVWPTTGRALGVSRNSAYNGANNGDIPTIDIGNRKRVPTSWLREKLGLN